MKATPIFSKISLLGAVCAVAVGCNRNVAPTVITTTAVSTQRDTVYLKSEPEDSIPCEDFEYVFFTDEVHDTVYVQVEKQVLKVRYVNRTDTVYRDKVVTVPAKVVTKNRNIGNAKVKNGSTGDNSPVSNKSGNTTKKNSWWWIFLAGFLTSVLVRRVAVPLISTYFPPLRVLTKVL